MLRKGILSLLTLLVSLRGAAAAEPVWDVVVYGGTSAAVIAGVQAKRMGKSVVLVSPDQHLGGLSAGGLGWTDSGNKGAIGGLSREFYHRVWQHYQQPEAWDWQTRESYGNKGQGTEAIDGAARTMWIFEPHVAEAVFEAFVNENGLRVDRDQWLDREHGVTKRNGRIAEIKTLAGNRYAGKMFIDATYEGDLMDAAGVGYHVGREANRVYGEKWNGIQVGVLHHGHWFKKPIDPYVIPGKPDSGLLPRISDQPPGEYGEGDHRIQAYCFRMCLTDHPENRIPFPKPANYDPRQYELILRVFASGWRETFEKFDPIPNRKTDTNNHGPFSTDNIGFNYDYPNGTYEQRRAIIQEHRDYQQGLMYFLANDPRVPDDVRVPMSKWGLPKDEFQDHGGWPHQIYVREARRMIGHYVMTELDCMDERETPESVGMGSYTLDSHNVQRYVTPEGYVQNEGDIGVGAPRPYEISYGSLVPKAEECQNLLVPVCLSSSHIAYGSIRMEPVFMILGQSAATAAAMAIDGNLAVQQVPYSHLRERLLRDGQVLELNDPRALTSRSLPGVVVDDRSAELVGQWSTSSTTKPFIDRGYLHDGNQAKGECTATFNATLQPGRYEVRIYYPTQGNRATNVPITIVHAEGTQQVTLDQRHPGEIDQVAQAVGTFTFGDQAKVVIGNAGTDGYTVVDAVQFFPKEPQ